MGIITDILKDVPLSAVLKEKIIKLENEMSVLKTENAVLKSENEELKSKIEIFEEKNKQIFHANLLWLKNDPNPYCPSCYGSEHKLIHMITVNVPDKVIDDSPIYKNIFRCSTYPKCKYYADITKHPNI